MNDRELHWYEELEKVTKPAYWQGWHDSRGGWGRADEFKAERDDLTIALARRIAALEAVKEGANED